MFPWLSYPRKAHVTTGALVLVATVVADDTASATDPTDHPSRSAAGMVFATEANAALALDQAPKEATRP